MEKELAIKMHLYITVKDKQIPDEMSVAEAKEMFPEVFEKLEGPYWSYQAYEVEEQ